MFKLLRNCCQFGEGWVMPNEIDEHGLAQALRIGFERALTGIKANPNEKIIIDGKVNYAPSAFKRVKTIIDGDAKVPIISSAGIYAKVRRDDFMSKLARQYPGYGFEHHVGYGTKAHQMAISTHGVIKLVHRFSYKPVSQVTLSEIRI
jgi:ribonuclease HII